MKTLLHPQPGFVLVKPLTKSSTGFVFSEGNTETQDGEVVEVGLAKENEYFSGYQTTSVKVGDRIIHRAYGKETYKLDGISYKFVLFKDIIGLIS